MKREAYRLANEFQTDFSADQDRLMDSPDDMEMKRYEANALREIRKEKRAALKSALTTKVEEKKFIVIDEIAFDEVKTKNFANILKNLDVSKALVVLEDDNVNAELSARNIADVKTAKTNTINVYDILKYNTVIATKAVAKSIEEVYA